MHPMILVFVVLGTWAAMAHADVYQCPDNTGKIFYQNRPCHDGAVPILTTPTRSTSRPVLPERRSVTLSSVSPTPPPVLTPARPAAAASTEESRLVDTRQLALIQRGMGKAEVERRLGPPQRVDAEEYEVKGLSRRKKQVRVEHWHYPGNSVVPPAVIVFKNGTVESRGRAGQEQRRSVSEMLHRR